MGHGPHTADSSGWPGAVVRPVPLPALAGGVARHHLLGRHDENRGRGCGDIPSIPSSADSSVPRRFPRIVLDGRVDDSPDQTPPPWHQSAIDAILDATTDQKLPAPVLIGIDGRSGSGKSGLADAARIALSRGPADPTEVAVLALEDSYQGWFGLAAALQRLCPDLLTPLSSGQTGAYLSYDWHHGRPAGPVAVPPRPIVIVEGVGALTVPCRGLYRLGIWLEAPARRRRARALARDGSTFGPYWEAWAQQEDVVFADGTARAGADLIIDT